MPSPAASREIRAGADRRATSSCLRSYSRCRRSTRCDRSATRKEPCANTALRTVRPRTSETSTSEANTRNARGRRRARWGGDTGRDAGVARREGGRRGGGEGRLRQGSGRLPGPPGGRHSGGLEGAPGGVGSARPPSCRPGHDAGQLVCRLDGPTGTGPDDGSSDPARPALLAELEDDPGQLLLGERVDELRGGRTIGTHAHVEGSIHPVSESALGPVQLPGGDAEVVQDAVGGFWRDVG